MASDGRWVVGLALLAISVCACTEASSPHAGGTSAPTPARSSVVAPADPKLADPLVGTTPPAWTTEEWTNSTPLTLEGLRGRVVLVRWFAGTSCPMCSASAPSLRAFHHDYAARGLTVVGMYHHKEDGPLKPGEYASYVRSFGFDFPVARDPDWKTLKAWWLDGHDRDYTSVSFLLDREGRVRGIHQGGRLAPDEPDYEAMKRGIERLLGEPARGG